MIERSWEFESPREHRTCVSQGKWRVIPAVGRGLPAKQIESVNPVLAVRLCRPPPTWKMGPVGVTSLEN